MTTVSDAIELAYHTARRTNGLSVVYSDGTNSVTLNVIPGETTFERETTPGLYTTTHSQDFLILAAELILDGAVVLPQMGDTVTATIGGSSVTYQVTSPDGDRHYRWSDPYKTVLRVFTMEV
jgi:hypothetical protein